MDRYLGKEVIENLLVMRFESIVILIWNRDNVANSTDYIQRTVRRGRSTKRDYFDKNGSLRMSCKTIVANFSRAGDGRAGIVRSGRYKRREVESFETSGDE